MEIYIYSPNLCFPRLRFRDSSIQSTDYSSCIIQHHDKPVTYKLSILKVLVMIHHTS